MSSHKDASYSLPGDYPADQWDYVPPVELRFSEDEEEMDEIRRARADYQAELEEYQDMPEDEEEQ